MEYENGGGYKKIVGMHPKLFIYSSDGYVP